MWGCVFGSRPSQGRKPLGTELGRVSEEESQSFRAERNTTHTVITGWGEGEGGGGGEGKVVVTRLTSLLLLLLLYLSIGGV